MINVSDEFKLAVHKPVKIMRAYLDDGLDMIDESGDLKTITITCDAALCKSVMRQAEVEYYGSHNYISSYVNLGIGVVLPLVEERGTVTLDISTNICTLTAYGLGTGAEVKLSTTDTLPTGLVSGVHYYIIRIDDDTFYLAESYDDAINELSIDLTGSQAGTHTLYSFPPGGTGDTEYIDYGSFKAIRAESNKGTDNIKLILYDKMYEALQAYDLDPVDDVGYPATLLELLQAICTRLSWTLATTTFPNSTLTIAEEIFANQQLSFRDVLDDIAEASGSIIMFNTDDELVVKQVSLSSIEATLDKHYLKSLKVEAQYGPINSVVLSRMPQEDNIAQTSP